MGVVPEAFGSEYGDDDGVDFSNVNPMNSTMAVAQSSGMGSGINPAWYMWGVPVSAIIGLFVLALWFKKG